MQGKKHYQPRLFKSFELSEKVPSHNFYRRLKEVLDLQFLYKTTETYYGNCGQKSLDPIVFYKLCLVGYLENIISDRQLIDHCSMRMDILYFLDYDVDEELPWHSTISRTRQLFPERVFEEVFNRVFSMCVDKGMVTGQTQAIDSAPVKANASMDSLELKVPKEKLEDYLSQVRYMSTPDREKVKRKAKENKASEQQQTLTATEGELKELESRTANWNKSQDQRAGSNQKGSRYTSNKTHYSPTDPDARISVKPGKARKLNYTSQLTVDGAHHVITDIMADYADKKDNQSLGQITSRVKQRLHKNGLLWHNVLADTGYSSGENYVYLEKQHLTSYIPAHGTYKGCPEHMTYNHEGDYYECRCNKRLTYRKTIRNRKGIKENHYATGREDCRDCPIAEQCKGKSHEKRIRITYYKPEYERAIARVNSKQGQYMKKKRQSTVEPVFGVLTQFMGMRKVNTRGIHQAQKVMSMAATAYNLKKYLKFTANRVQSGVQEVQAAVFLLFQYIRGLYLTYKLMKT